jgi:hypothetical protein
MTGIDIKKYLKNPGLLNEATLLEVQNLTEEFPAFNLGWALWLKNLKNTNSPLYFSNLKQAALRIPDRKWLKNFLETTVPRDQEIQHDEYLLIDDYDLGSENGAAPNEVKPSDTKKGLIEHFLLSGAVFSKQLKPGGSPIPNLEERSLAETDDIITETYANILLAQGMHVRARDAFEKLILKYPEKSIYFAARIQEVEKLMNHKELQ